MIRPNTLKIMMNSKKRSENKLAIYIDQSAVVKTEKIEAGSKIWQFVVVLEGAQIGRDCNICAHCFIENDVLIGNNVTIKCGVSIWDGITIEDNAFVGPNVAFTNDLRPRSKKYPEEFLKTTIQRNASLGANSTIVAGCTIGKNAMVGAGSVVTKDIPDNTLWYGCPARFISYICDCGEKLSSELTCEKCSSAYELTGKKIRRKAQSES